MDRIRTEARGNRIRIGFVACLDIRFDYLFHALSNRGLRHSASLLSIAPGGMNGRYIPHDSGHFRDNFWPAPPHTRPNSGRSVPKTESYGHGTGVDPLRKLATVSFREAQFMYGDKSWVSDCYAIRPVRE